MSDRINDILQYWFSDLSDEVTIDKNDMKVKKWFMKDAAIDEHIRENFKVDLQKAYEGQYKDWELSMHGRLALIILYDQFTRNMFRNTKEMFAYDHLALGLAKKSIDEELSETIPLVYRVFCYMPLMHAEDLPMQELCVEVFTRLIEESNKLSPQNTFYYESNLSFANRHKDIVEQFGRFPHRNKILGRESTKEEEDFLQKPGSSF